MKILDAKQGQRCDAAEYLTFTHRRCATCKKVKAVGQFYKKNTRTARGWYWDSRCIDCRRVECKSYSKTDRTRHAERVRQWRRKNPEKAKINTFKGRLKHVYGITPEQLEAMKVAQNHRCAICDRKPAKLLIDHNHTTGKVRSLLCPTCNTFLGWYETKADTIIAFQTYLEEHT